MAKLTGKKKLEFLARLNAGRVKAGLKRIKAKGSRSTPKTELKRIKKNPKRRITLPKLRKQRKSNKRKKTSSSVAKKKSKGGRRRSVGNFLKTGTIGKVAAGVGAATLVGFATDRLAPSISPIAKLGAAFAAGGGLGVISQFLIQGGLGGSGINLQNILGGGGNGANGTDMV